MRLTTRLQNATEVIKNEGLVGFFRKIACKFPKVFPNKTLTVQQILERRFSNSQPPKTLRVELDKPRLNLVIDSLAKDSFYGGTATALILATLTANQLKMPLRIISRTQLSHSSPYNELLELFKINKPSGLQFFSDWSMVTGPGSRRMELSSKDIFLASSWWSSQAIQQINLMPYYFYILQEDETLFYPSGDDQLKLINSFKNDQAYYLVNTKFLYDHLSQSSLIKLNQSNSIWFEPAITSSERHTWDKATGERYKLFFYARPGHPRNLYYHALAWLDEAFTQGILDANEWEIFVGGCDSLKPFNFTTSVKTQFIGKLSWQEYRKLIGTIDLCFSLVCTPHPSYPPLDFAASGAVVLTNKFGNKQPLSYSPNIIMCDLDNRSMLSGFREAAELVKAPEMRQKHLSENQLETNWESALKLPLEYMQKIVNSHATH